MPSNYIICIVAALAVSISIAHSAEIREVGRRNCSLDLSGAIIEGDADRFAKVLNQHKADEFDERTTSICLNSPGGSYAEGLKIGESVYNSGFSTVIEDGAQCFSACATIFMSGVVYGKALPYRKLSVGGVLGFHAPYLLVPDTKYTKAEIEAATQAMRQSILALVKLSSKATKLGSTDFIKKSLLTRILERRPDELVFVRTVSQAARWDIEIYDADKAFSPAANKVLEMQNLCRNFHASNMDQPINQQQALSVRAEQYSSKFHKDDFRVLVEDARAKDTVCEIYPRTMSGTSNVIFTGCSLDYWSGRGFGDCRRYKSDAIFGKHIPSFLRFAPETKLLKFR